MKADTVSILISLKGIRFIHARHLCRFAFFSLCACLISYRCSSQLYIGSEALTIKKDVSFFVDSLLVKPDADLTVSNNLLQRSHIPTALGNSLNSIPRLYQFATPFLYSGELGFFYGVGELNLAQRCAVQAAYFTNSSLQGWILESPSLPDSSRNFLALSFSNKFLSGFSATENPNLLMDAVLSGNICAGDSLLVISNQGASKLTWIRNDKVIKTVLPEWLSGGATIAGSNLNELKNPVMISRTLNGDLYVCDQLNHRVVKYPSGSSAGLVVAGGNGAGNGLNQLNSPSGIFITSNDELYVSDQSNHRVVKWLPGASVGTVIAGGNGLGTTADKFKNPGGIFVDPTGNLYVADKSNNRIQKWPAGASSAVTVAGGLAGGPGLNQLDNPVFVCVQPQGTMYISDSYNDRVLKWNAGATSGTVVAGGNGTGASLNQLNRPAGFSMDVNEDIYIADQNNHRVIKLSKSDGLTAVVAGGNGSGKQANRLNKPSAVIYGGDRLFVCDQNNDRVQSFSSDVNKRIVAPAAGDYFATIVNKAGCTDTTNTISTAASNVIVKGSATIVHGDGEAISYIGSGCKLIADIEDAAGGNILSTTTATANRDSSVQTFSGKPYVQRHFDLLPASNGPGIVTLYVTKSEFNAYNTFVNGNLPGMPLLPNASNSSALLNIVITHFKGEPVSGNTGPGGVYDISQSELIQNAFITKTFVNSSYWKLSFPVSEVRGGYYIHTGLIPLRQGPDDYTRDDGFFMEAYPNPASSYVTVHITGEMNGTASLQLLDVTGKVLKQVITGEHETTFDLTNVLAGSYLIRFKDDIHTEVVRITRQ
jgi:sugar lactone lactonase YvrE